MDVLQQMMATAMPCIATMHSDIPYIFGEYSDLLVPERDAVAIADRIQRYVDDPDLLITDGTALRDRMRSAFDVDSCSVGLSNLYDEVLGIASGQPKSIPCRNRQQSDRPERAKIILKAGRLVRLPFKHMTKYLSSH
jgi:hypothetical protein